MNFIEIANVKVSKVLSLNEAILVWIKKPHVVNRRLCGASIIFDSYLHKNEKNIDCTSLVESLKLDFFDRQIINSDLIEELCSKISSGCQFMKKQGFCDKTYFFLRKIVSRESFLPTYEAILTSESFSITIFLPFYTKNDYAFKFCTDTQRLILLCNEDYIDSQSFSKLKHKASHADASNVKIPKHNSDVVTSGKNSNDSNLSTINEIKTENSRNYILSKQWLSEKLLTKLQRWCCLDSINSEQKSLLLVDMASYQQQLHRLKNLYAKHLVENWTESTDPQKYVYEDLSIAAYLLTYWSSWRSERIPQRNEDDATEDKAPIRFVDVGCGNGLLVYLLNCEGHKGYGVDVRARKVWQMLQPQADLRVASVDASVETFNDCDWLIGNHSDELTPWIPVMAARSPNCNFFLLPCCPFDFYGKFFNFSLQHRTNGEVDDREEKNISKNTTTHSIKTKETTAKSATKNKAARDETKAGGKYKEYLQYIELICGDVCNFEVQGDVLRIPSTRRTCFIGKATNNVDLNKIQEFLTSRNSLVANQSSDSSNGKTLKEFKARSSEEASKGAWKIPKKCMQEAWVRAMNVVLETGGGGDDREGGRWRQGESVPMSELGRMMGGEVLRGIRGGLQTILKSCPDVFSVREGVVTLRDWRSEEFESYSKWRGKKNKKKVDPKDKLKTKACFYHTYHPDGCPHHTSSLCKFAHGTHELR